MAQPNHTFRQYMEVSGLDLKQIRAIEGIPDNATPKWGIHLNTSKGIAYKQALDAYFTEHGHPIPDDLLSPSTPPGSTQQGGNPVVTLGDYMLQEGISLKEARKRAKRPVASENSVLSFEDLSRLGITDPTTPKAPASQPTTSTRRSYSEISGDIQAIVQTANTDLLTDQTDGRRYVWEAHRTERRGQRVFYPDIFGGKEVSMSLEEWQRKVSSNERFPMTKSEHSDKLRKLFVELLQEFDAFRELDESAQVNAATSHMYDVIRGESLETIMTRERHRVSQSKKDAALEFDEMKRRALETQKSLASMPATAKPASSPVASTRRVVRSDRSPQKVVEGILRQTNFVESVIVPGIGQYDDAITAALPDWSATATDEEFSHACVMAVMRVLQEASETA